MIPRGEIGFSALDRQALEDHLHEKSAEAGLEVADAYFDCVLENLLALQSHAAILAARALLRAEGPNCDPAS